MKLFDYETYSDYGNEWFFQVLSSPKFALLDLTVQWDEFPPTELFPMLIMSIGSNHLFGFTFRWKWFEIRVDFFQSRPRNLERYRRDYD